MASAPRVYVLDDMKKPQRQELRKFSTRYLVEYPGTYDILLF